ncbi:ATP-binding protein [Jatrophihabitans sp.]|uniref:ATP-binding protein n=1 Tax=Jatrophihabitans sp. TaxID=1932789 RepID=UPI002C6E4439|nr:ATP-binding protein [Jatrophihabitans sp.]
MRQRLAELVEQVAVAARRRAEAGGSPGVAELDAIVAVLRSDYQPAGDGAADDVAERDVLTGVGEVFGLDPVDAGLLTIAVAADLDANLGMAFGLLRGLTGPARPSVALALELTGIPTLAADGFDRLGPDGPLRRHRLVEVQGNEPWLGRQLRVPDPVAAFLAGSDASDPAVAAMLSFPVPIALAETPAVAAAIDNGVPLVWISASAAAAGNSLAAGAFGALGLRCLAVDLRRCPADVDLLTAVAAAAREAGLRGCGLVVTGAELLGEPAAVAGLELLERAAVPVIAVGSRPWNPAWLRRFPLAVDARPLAVADRAAIWRTGLGELASSDEQLRNALLGLRLTPEEVLETARYARMLADSRHRPLSAELVREAARRVGGSGGAGVHRIPARSGPASQGPTFDDLVLPEHARRSLQQLVSWARVRDQVTARGPLRAKGSGIAALFTGSPGTGKTLAANVIAEELSIDLFQVDLSAIVDKYIGETEKNLEKVFQSAEALDVVLFFDEADALFGSRSEVRDSRDRYANQEVAYLLQRMEQFDGITILATNLRGNLDQAFSRRMSFIVHFPDPDAATRRRLWQSHLGQLPELDPEDPIDLDFLAESVELSGGDIRNIVLSAAYDAISADQLVGMRHLAVATVGEYHKLGRRVPEHAFLPA